MNTKTLRYLMISFALILGVGQRTAFADDIVNITVNTSSLPVVPGSEIVFELTDGSGIGDANNTATLSGFGLGGGFAGGVDTINSTGGFAPASSLGSAVSLTDSSFLNLFGQFLTPGNSLSFTLDLTTNLDAGGTPDQFSMYIFDPNGIPIATTDPTLLDSLLTINLDAPNPTSNNYVPTLLIVTPVPEPSSLLLIVLGFASLGLLRRRVRLSD
jgi:hypothetical protein